MHSFNVKHGQQSDVNPKSKANKENNATGEVTLGGAHQLAAEGLARYPMAVANALRAGDVAEAERIAERLWQRCYEAFGGYAKDQVQGDTAEVAGKLKALHVILEGVELFQKERPAASSLADRQVGGAEVMVLVDDEVFDAVANDDPERVAMPESVITCATAASCKVMAQVVRAMVSGKRHDLVQRRIRAAKKALRRIARCERALQRLADARADLALGNGAPEDAREREVKALKLLQCAARAAARR